MFNFVEKVLKNLKNKSNVANNARDIQDLMICGLVGKRNRYQPIPYTSHAHYFAYILRS